MTKIKKIIVNYPEDPKDMEKLQDTAMAILAKSIIKELSPVEVKELIKRLQDSMHQISKG
ncbi:hypothetical protein [Clostridium botulinum]|uniref:hypothetical protein n=1 Tax=Clostridium botulinum TaxID=1491 RepID=UPI0004D48003|nr:hypothetical protein [Clostridium botulinum]KEH90585.1 hypothetical protein Z963_11740 [Clostridium botulinum C/D str. It1]